MAEWLRRGLQILARRFDSGSGLHVAKAKLALANAALAQLVEHIIRNDGVTCSSHVSGTTSGRNLGALPDLAVIDVDRAGFHLAVAPSTSSAAAAG